MTHCRAVSKMFNWFEIGMAVKDRRVLTTLKMRFEGISFFKTDPRRHRLQFAQAL